MRQNTELIAQGLRSAMEHEFKSPLQITWAVDPTLVSTASAPTSSTRSIGSREPEAEETYSPDESVIVVDSAGDHLITEMFPGATEVTRVTRYRCRPSSMNSGASRVSVRSRRSASRFG